MGQQQLLLIMLGVIIVGVAVVIGIQTFNSNSIEANRDLILGNCINLASMAQKYYRIPKQIGGGGYEFTNWDIPSGLKNTENGTFTAVATATDVIITAIGNETLPNGDNIEVQMKVLANNTEVILLK